MTYLQRPPIPRDQMLRIGDVVRTGQGECVVFGIERHWCCGNLPMLASQRGHRFGFLTRRIWSQGEIVRRGDFEAAARIWRQWGWQELNTVRRAKMPRTKALWRSIAAKYERRAALILNLLRPAIVGGGGEEPPQASGLKSQAPSPCSPRPAAADLRLRGEERSGA